MEGQQYIIQQQEDEEEGPREGELREQDRFLPIYNISKVLTNLLPKYEVVLDRFLPIYNISKVVLCHKT